MARMPRVAVSGYPHHVTQRGNRRQKTFYCKEDYQYYLELISEFTKQSGTEVWACCLMPNYVHMVMVPSSEDELWSSASAHLAGNNDILVTVKPMLDRINNWQQYLSSSNSCNSDNELVAQHTRTGRPLGSDSFVKELESICGKSLAPQKPGALCSLVIGKY